jgi:hypothetical protein
MNRRTLGADFRRRFGLTDWQAVRRGLTGGEPGGYGCWPRSRRAVAMFSSVATALRRSAEPSGVRVSSYAVWRTSACSSWSFRVLECASTSSLPPPYAKKTRYLRESCGTWRCFVVLSGDKCNGCHVSSRLLTKIPSTKSAIYGPRQSPPHPRFSCPPTTNQVVGSSNLSGRANFSYRDSVLPRFTSPNRLRDQLVAEVLPVPVIGQLVAPSVKLDVRIAASPTPATSPATTVRRRSGRLTTERSMGQVRLRLFARARQSWRQNLSAQ